MSEIYQQAKVLQSELVEIRREIHRNAEVGTQLPHTKALVKEKLIAYGYEPRDIANSSIVATISGELPGKTMLLRADMDGLAIQEETALDFKCINGAMHGCGHDMHTAMLLGAAKLLKKHQNLIHGNVKLLFQEDEEGFTGAKSVIEDGVLENPKVDAAMALHVNSGTPSNMVLCGLGHFMAGCTLFRIEVSGVSCHGAMPENGIDPINIAAHIYLSLQEIAAREVAAQDPCVLTIGKFAGGQTPNIIPEKAVLEGTIRYKNKETGDRIFERIQEISNLCAQSFRGKAAVTEIASAPPLINNDEMMHEFCDDIKQFIAPQQVMILPQGGMGSEDFASFSYRVPVAYLLLGAGTSQENEAYGKPMHNQCVVFNEDVLCLGSSILTICAMNWLNKHRND
ncbi:MAG: M20 family metallopeptidase [Christensenella sp.]|mgnify:FL=1|jgi:amidohydrolase|nr:M20 family metallopeptidase [Christensenella sp.]